MEDAIGLQIIEALLELADRKPLEKITITELIQKAGVSRTAFNNRFSDMNHLITDIWESRILKNSWDGLTESQEDYRLGCLLSFKRYMKYQRFMRQACRMTGQNCLRDYMVASSIRFEEHHLGKDFSDSHKPEELRFLTRYHAYAITNLVIEWLENNCRQKPEVLADLVTKTRYTVMQTKF